MRRIWVPVAALAASVFVAGWMAQSSAEDQRPGVALPPPSLFDDAPNQVRAVGTPAAAPASAVVQAKPAAAVKAEANLPPPENFEEPQAGKVVWWKPWTWFSGRTRRNAEPAQPPVAVTPKAVQPQIEAHNGFAVDSPSQRIRTGMGGCVKTGMWQGDGKADPCGAGQTAEAAAPLTATPASAATANASTPTAPAAAPKAAATTAAVPIAPAPQPERVEVSALVPEQDDQRRPLGEKDSFDSVRVNAAGTDALSPSSVAAARAGRSAGGDAGTAREEVAKSAPSPAPAPASAARPAPRLVEDRPLSMSAEALFGFKSATLLHGGKVQLDDFAKKLSDGDYQNVLVVGHTDRVGAPVRNKRLSLRRAKAVKEYLVMKGIAPNRISVDGRGAAEPVTEPRQCDGLPMTARRACMSPDRRVEIVVTRALAKRRPEAAPGNAPRS